MPRVSAPSYLTPLGVLLPMLLGLPLVLAALLRLVPEREGGARRVAVDVALALACAGVATWLAGWVTWPKFFLGIGADGSDHAQYCQAVGAVRRGVLSGVAGAQRSAVAAALPALFARRLGILDGLALGAVVSFAVLVAGMYAWARILAGRVAGVVAAVACGSMTFVATLPRTLTFYPENAAVTVLAAAATSATLVVGSWASFGLAGTALGLALLLDLRGITVVLPLLGLAVVAAFVGPIRRVPLRLLLLVVPLVLSFRGAREVTQASVPTVEQAVEAWIGSADHRPTGFLHAPNLEHGGFVWGRSDLRGLPSTLRWLAGVSGGAGRAPPQDTLPIRSLTVGTWLPALAAWGAVAGIGLGWRWRSTVALLVTCAPMLLSLRQALLVLPQYRFVQGGMLVAPLLFGVAFGVVAARDGPRRLVLGAAIALAMATGWVPSVLGLPRERQVLSSSGTGWVTMAKTAGSEDRGCAQALAEDQAAGIDIRKIRVLGIDLGAGEPKHK